MSEIDPTTYEGYRAHTRSRKTGTLVILVQSDEGGVESDPNLPWSLICVEHGGCVCFETQRQARDHMSRPDDWCPTCQYPASDPTKPDAETEQERYERQSRMLRNAVSVGMIDTAAATYVEPKAIRKYHVSVEHKGDRGLGGGVWSGFNVEAETRQQAEEIGLVKFGSERGATIPGRVKVEQIDRWEAVFRYRKDKRRRETFIVTSAGEGMAKANAKYSAGQHLGLEYEPVKLTRIGPA